MKTVAADLAFATPLPAQCGISVKKGIIDPLVPTGRGSFVHMRSTTLGKVLASFDRAYPEYTDWERDDVIKWWRDAEKWMKKNEALALSVGVAA